MSAIHDIVWVSTNGQGVAYSTPVKLWTVVDVFQHITIAAPRSTAVVTMSARSTPFINAPRREEKADADKGQEADGDERSGEGEGECLSEPEGHGIGH